MGPFRFKTHNGEGINKAKRKTRPWPPSKRRDLDAHTEKQCPAFFTAGAKAEAAGGRQPRFEGVLVDCQSLSCLGAYPETQHARRYRNSDGSTGPRLIYLRVCFIRYEDEPFSVLPSRRFSSGLPEPVSTRGGLELPDSYFQVKDTSSRAFVCIQTHTSQSRSFPSIVFVFNCLFFPLFS